MSLITDVNRDERKKETATNVNSPDTRAFTSCTLSPQRRVLGPQTAQKTPHVPGRAWLPLLRFRPRGVHQDTATWGARLVYRITAAESQFGKTSSRASQRVTGGYASESVITSMSVTFPLP